ncbi:hypothetical protein Cmtc_08610 [Cupriavidus sp. TKC]|uniref:YdaS family helix-turn-helix protein n=1 Tax=Cupriavidus sp. TKC TaxID=2880159 RepID=UPI0025A80F9F|nr:YdaS family helix-turn-helix protein [Cupriavidus sp. TKC]GMG89641.1 hypothetical protein Cmtc_08610 [Cupriavidus sp. TKC]
MEENLATCTRQQELRSAIKLAGGASAVAARLGISREAVYDFIRRGNFKADHCPEIEELSSGLVRCEVLNNKVKWEILRSPTSQPSAAAPDPLPGAHVAEAA